MHLNTYYLTYLHPYRLEYEINLAHQSIFTINLLSTSYTLSHHQCRRLFFFSLFVALFSFYCILATHAAACFFQPFVAIFFFFLLHPSHPAASSASLYIAALTINSQTTAYTFDQQAGLSAHCPLLHLVANGNEGVLHLFFKGGDGHGSYL